MPPLIIVKSDDPHFKTSREETAQRVIAEFRDQLPDPTLLCFFDDVDWESFKSEAGKANRGFYRPLTTPGPPFPDYVSEHIYADAPGTWFQNRVVDHVIYLHGSTCSEEIGFSMTFAHELQHFVQWGRMSLVYASGILLVQLLRHLPRETSDDLGLKLWADIPHERDARIVAKRVVENLFGQQRTAEFIAKRVANPVNEDDLADWRFIQSIASSDSYDVDFETRRLFQRLLLYRSDCEKVLQQAAEHIPELKHLDLDMLFGLVEH